MSETAEKMAFEQVEQIVTILASDENGTNTTVLPDEKAIVADSRKTNEKGFCVRVNYEDEECTISMVSSELTHIYDRKIPTNATLQVWCETMVKILGSLPEEFEAEIKK